MPLMLPYEGVHCVPGNPVLMLWGKDKITKSDIAKGGTLLHRDLHYLQKIEGFGLCHFAPTRKNYCLGVGLIIIVRLADIQSPHEFKQRVINLYTLGKLVSPNEHIQRYYDQDDISIIPNF